jgi:hypothetical protein
VADAAGTAETAAARISGYTLVLPGAWRRIPVQQGTRPAIRGVVDEVLRRFSKGVSRDNVTPYRIELERRLSDMAAQARSAGGIDLYLPIEYTHGVTITASFVVSQVTLPEPPPELPDVEQADTALFVSYLTSADGDAAPVVIAGAAAARKESVAAADPAQQVPYGSRRVDYMLPVPGESRGMLIVAFSTIGDGDPEGQFAKLLVELFDAIMTTFRWAGDQSGARDQSGQE